MGVYTVYQPVTAVYGCGQLLAAKAIQSKCILKTIKSSQPATTAKQARMQRTTAMESGCCMNSNMVQPGGNKWA